MVVSKTRLSCGLFGVLPQPRINSLNHLIDIWIGHIKRGCNGLNYFVDAFDLRRTGIDSACCGRRFQKTGGRIGVFFERHLIGWIRS